jgi:hypothetical protein
MQRDREASITSVLADPANQRYSPERQIGGIRPGARTRSPWPDEDEEDEDGMMYHSGAGPVMYSNLNGVGPPTRNMQMAQATPFPITPAVYIPARASSRSPSPKLDSVGIPSTGTYTRLPYLDRRSDSVSPVPSANAPTTPNHGSGAPVPSGSAGNVSAGNGSGSGETAVPNAPTPTHPSPRPGSPPLENIYPPAYEQFAGDSPRIGFAYEPSPVQHTHQITVGLPDVQGHDAPRASEDSGGIVNASEASRSIYSQDDSEDWVGHNPAVFNEDQRIDPVMRIQGGLVSAASVGPRDHEDYMRRVLVRMGSCVEIVDCLLTLIPSQPPPAPSAGSHSQSHSHSTH